MLKKIKSKKSILVISAMLIMILLIGATYSWFTYKDTEVTDIQMGNLSISAEFEKLNDAIYEPGDLATSDGSIKNTGSIAALVKVNANTKIKLKYKDDNFTLDTEQVWSTDDKGAVTSSIGGTSYGYGMDDEGNLIYCWMVDKNNENDKYVLLAPGGEIEVTLNAQLNGPVMTNQYNDALIRINTEVQGTQAYSGAIEDLFGVAFEDLEIYLNPTVRSAKIPEEVVRQVNEMFHN